MKIPHKREPQQIAFCYSPGIDFQVEILIENWNFIKNVPWNHIFLVIDATLVSENSSSFRKNFLEEMHKIDDNIWDEKVKYDIIRKVAKILALSSGKIDRYEFLKS